MREKNCSDEFIRWFFYYLTGRSRENGLELNFSKTIATIIGSDQMLMLTDISSLPPLTVNGNNIRIVDSVNNLGLTRTSYLTWNKYRGQMIARAQAQT